MGILLSHGLGITLKSLNEVKQTLLIHFELDWLARSDVLKLRGAKEDACMTDQPVSMLMRFGGAAGGDCHLCPWVSLCSGSFVEVRGLVCCRAAEWHHARERDTEESVSMRLMKGSADNPADQRLPGEIGAHLRS